MRLQTKYNAFIVVRNLKKYNIMCVAHNINYIDVEDNAYDLNVFKPFIARNEFNYICVTNEHYIFIFIPYCVFIDEYLKYNKYGAMHYINNNMSLITFKAYDYCIGSYIIKCHIYDMHEHVKHLHSIVQNKHISIDMINTISKHYVYKKITLSIYDTLKRLFVYERPVFYELIQEYYAYNCITNICAAKKYNIEIKGATDISDSKKYVDEIIKSLNIHNKHKLTKYIKHEQKVYDVNINNTIIHIRILRKLQHIPLCNLSLCQSINLLANITYVDNTVVLLIKRIDKLFKKTLYKRNGNKHFDKHCIQLLNKIYSFDICNIKEIVQIFNYVLDNYYIIDLYDEDAELLVNVYNKFKDILVS